MSEVGLARFADLCIGDDAPVHNPKLFRDFVFVYVNGTDADVGRVASGERAVDAVKRGVSRRSKKQAFREDVAAIRERVGALTVTDFQGTQAEKNEISRLCRIVNRRLLPLIGGA